MSSLDDVEDAWDDDHGSEYKHRPVHGLGRHGSGDRPKVEETYGSEENESCDVDREAVFSQCPSPCW